MTPLQKLPKNVGDLGKIIVAKGFKKFPKVQKIPQSGHTDGCRPLCYRTDRIFSISAEMAWPNAFSAVDCDKFGRAYSEETPGKYKQ